MDATTAYSIEVTAESVRKKSGECAHVVYTPQMI